MRNRRERALQEICDVNPTLSQPQTTPVLRGNLRMQGPSDEANCDSQNNMVTSESSNHCSGRSQKVDYRGNSGACNVCSAPCSSCRHFNKVSLKSNNESAGETCAGNTETGQLSILSVVGGMGSTADSFSENAAGKDSSRTYNASASDDSLVHSKRNGWRSPEGHDDCLSCVSGTDEQVNRKSDTEDSGNKSNKHNKTGGENSGKVSPSSSQTEVSYTKNTDDATHIQKAHNTSSNAKTLLHEEIPTNVNDDNPSDTNVELLKAPAEYFNSSLPNGMVSDNACGDPPKMDQDSIRKNDEMDVETHSANESDDSDMVEQDVKVCDICGDAGREDLLAICARCSDGAEHTYCMRQMLEKLPEGEWLCEECKALELVGNGKQKVESETDRASENLNNSDFEDHRTKGFMRNPSKRFRDDEDAEVSSVAKKPALESTIGSPKTPNSKLAILCRENSFKRLDKSRLQSPNRSTLDTVPTNDATELAKPASDARGLTLRGTFAKSSSFNSLNSKPKVKLVDQVVIQRQKSVKEHSSFRLKEGIVRSIGKPMPFRSTNSNRSESKIKMLSPRSPHNQDVKNTKERSAFERQRSFRTEHPPNNSMMGTSMNSTSRIDKRPLSRAESSSLATHSNHHEVKQGQTDSKSAALSRSSSLAARRTADLPSSTGDFRRPSKHAHSTSVVSSANEVNSTEQKYNQTSLKQDPAPCPGGSEKLSVNASEGLFGGLALSKDIIDSADRSREYSGSRYKPPSVRSRDEGDNLKAAIEAAVLKKPGVYRRHRSFGQSDESSVPTVAPVASHIDRLSSVRNIKLPSDAELAERPSLSRKTADPFKEEASNSGNHSLQLLVPADDLSSAGHEGVHIDLSSRDTFSNIPTAIPLLLKSIALPEQEYIWQGSLEICRNDQTYELWDGFQAHLSTCASPKVFEAVNKFKNRIVLCEVPRANTWPVQFQENGVREDNIALFFFAKDLQSYDKVYKVLLENMMKNDLALKGNINGVELLIFPSNQLPVNLQRWNMLFFLWGVFRGKKESSLQKMPESVIAPRDIPPPIMSLPENGCSIRSIPENANQNVHPMLEVPASESVIAPRDIPPAIMTLPKNRCSIRSIPENANQNAHPVFEVPASEELQGLPGVVKREVDISPSDQLGHGLNSSPSSGAQSDGANLSGEVRGAFQEGGIRSSCSLPVAMASPGNGKEQRLMQPEIPLGNPHLPHDSSNSVPGTPKEGISGPILDKKCHQTQSKPRMNVMDLSKDAEISLEDDMSTRVLNVEEGTGEEPILDKQCYQNQSKPRMNVIDLSIDAEISLEDDMSTRTRDLNVEEGTGEGPILDKKYHQNQSTPRMDVIDLSADAEASLEDDMSTRDLNVEPNSWLFKKKEPMLPGPSSLGHQTLSAVTGQVSARNDDVHNETRRTLEKVPTVSYAPHNQHPKYYEHAERYFFPVRTQPDGSMPWKTRLLDKDGLNDRAPNLELALGAERTSLTLGMEPMLIDKVEQKVEENDILEEARKKAEDDVSASLSLSLSFPFPDAKPSPKTEQLMSQRKHVNTPSRLLFGNLRER